MKTELSRLREYAKKYSEIAFSDNNLKRPEQYRKLNNLEMVRPPILVFEVPWGELENQDELKLDCETDAYRGIERGIKRNLYQFKYFEGDYAIHPYYKVKIRTKSTGIGLNVEEVKINSTTGTDIIAHEYHDILPDEESLERIKMPVIEVDDESTKRALQAAHDVFDGIMDELRISSTARSSAWQNATYDSLWDTLLTYGSEETGGSEPESSSNILFIFSNF